MSTDLTPSQRLEIVLVTAKIENLGSEYARDVLLEWLFDDDATEIRAEIAEKWLNTQRSRREHHNA